MRIILTVMAALLLAAPCLAIDIGKGLELDGYLTAGKVYAVDRSESGPYERIGFTSLKDSFYSAGEVGIRHKVIRPFVGYDTLTKDYIKTSIGADVFFAEWQGMAIGVRTQYTTHRKYKAERTGFLYSGLTVRF